MNESCKKDFLTSIIFIISLTLVEGMNVKAISDGSASTLTMPLTIAFAVLIVSWVRSAYRHLYTAYALGALDAAFHEVEMDMEGGQDS